MGLESVTIGLCGLTLPQCGTVRGAKGITILGNHRLYFFFSCVFLFNNHIV